MKLCDQIVRLYSYIGDLVFDPFAGSGTLGKAAIRLDRHFFMTEIQEDYIARIRENIGGMFGHDKPVRFLDFGEFKREARKWR